MAKLSSIKKNDNRKKLVLKMSKKRADLKEKIYDKTISLEDRFSLVMKLAEVTRNSASNRVRNRCALTGRSRGVYRKFDLSRSMIRKLWGEGALPGVIKASW